MTCLRDATVFRFPDLDVRDLQVITRILRDLLDDRDHDERAHGVEGLPVSGFTLGPNFAGPNLFHTGLFGADQKPLTASAVRRILREEIEAARR